MRKSTNLLIFLAITGVSLVIFNQAQSDFAKLFHSVQSFYHFDDRIECNHRDYGYGSTVCVCTIQHCDNLHKITKTPKGIVQVYETSKNGDRFKFSRVKFNEDLTDEHYYSIRVNRNQTFQKIIGFGGSITDAAGYNIRKLPLKLQERLIRDYYGSDGISYNLARVPIGGSDFSSRGYTYDDNADDDQLEKFSLQPEDYDYKIPFLKMMQEITRNRAKFFGSPWSSPAWMKTNNDLRHGGFLKGQPGGKYYKMFAKYFVKFLQEYQKQNVTFWGITIENEPASGFDPKYRWNCLGFNSTMERDFLKMDLGPELYRNGWTKDKLNIMIYDDQMPNMKNFTETLMSDPLTEKYVSGVAYHWYHNQEANRNDLDELYRKYPQIFLLSTEACEEWRNHPNHVYLGSWQTFNRYSMDIIEDLNHYTSGWVDWNLALDLIGGPNWVGNFVDAPIIVNETSGEYYKQPMFYAMGHFSKFLESGSIRIGHQLESNEIRQLMATAFQRPDQAIVLIVLNINDGQKIPIQIEDHERGRFNFEMQPQSMISFVWY